MLDTGVIETGHEDEEAAAANSSDAGNELRRVVMVTTSFWHWAFDDEHLAQLRGLLESVLRRDIKGEAWVLRPAEGGIAHRPASSPRLAEAAVERLYAPPPRQPQWRPGSAAAAGLTVDEIVAAVQEVGAERKQGTISADDAAHALRGIDIRVFAQPDRAAALFGAHEILAYCACLDITFTKTRVEDRDHYVCLVSASVWSNRPHSRWHAPPDECWPESISPGDDRVDVEFVSKCYLGEVRAGIRRLLGSHLDSPAIPTIQNMPYVAPVYWVIACGGPNRVEAESRAVRNLLGTTDLDAAPVSASMLAGSLCMHRRVLGDPGVAVPFYVLVPVAHRPALHGAQADAFRQQEDDAAAAVLALTELEIQVSTLTFDIDTDLTLWENYVRLYASSADRGAALWDALAMHLPVAEDKTLDKVHNAIALIHQTLLQSVADLNYVATKIDSAGASLIRRAAELQGEFDGRIAERRAIGSPDSAALGEHSDIGFERRRVAQACAEVERVRSNFRGLFDSITKAFDERRTRETDQFAKQNLTLGQVVGFIALLNLVGLLTPFLLAISSPGQAVPGSLPSAGFWLLFSGVVLFVVVVFLFGLFYFRSGIGLRVRLGDEEFQMLYPELRDFLRKVSTAELENLKRGLTNALAPGQPLPEPAAFMRKASSLVSEFLGSAESISLPAGACLPDRRAALQAGLEVTWNAVDENLSALLERTWGSVYSVHGAARHSNPSDDVDALLSNVGHWTMKSMLLNERPPELYRFDLPQLIALYCALSASEDSFLRTTSYAEPVTAISAIDMGFVLQGLSFPPTEFGAIHRWLGRARPGMSAEDIAKDVRRLGLRNGMDDGERDRAIGVVHRGNQP